MQLKTHTSESALMIFEWFRSIVQFVFLLFALQVVIGCGRNTSEAENDRAVDAFQSTNKESANTDPEARSGITKDGSSVLTLSYKTRLLSPTSNNGGRLCYRLPSITHWVRCQITVVNIVANSPSISTENDQLELTVVDTAGLNAHLSKRSRIELSFDNADMPMGSTFAVGDVVYVGLSGEVDLIAVLAPACAEDIVQDVK